MIGCLVADGTTPRLSTPLGTAVTKAGAKFKGHRSEGRGRQGRGRPTDPGRLPTRGRSLGALRRGVIAVSAEGAQQLAMQASASALCRMRSPSESHRPYASRRVVATEGKCDADRGVIAVASGAAAGAFVTEASKGRIWEREPKVRQGRLGLYPQPYSESSVTFSTARNASCGISTRPTRFMRCLPSFCFSSSLRLREMSPP